MSLENYHVGPDVATYLRTEYRHGAPPLEELLRPPDQGPSWLTPIHVPSERSRAIGKILIPIHNAGAQFQQSVFDRFKDPVIERLEPLDLLLFRSLIMGYALYALDRVRLLDIQIPPDLGKTMIGALAVYASAKVAINEVHRLRSKFSLYPDIELGFNPHPLDEDEVKSDLRYVANKLIALCTQDNQSQPPGLEDVVDCVGSYMKTLYGKAVKPSTKRPKQSLFPRGAYARRRAGAHFPTSGEVVLTNPTDKVITAHEMAHACGVYDEPSTEMVGILALISSDNPDLQKHGYLRWFELLFTNQLLLKYRDKQFTREDLKKDSDDLYQSMNIPQEIIALKEDINNALHQALLQEPKGRAVRAMWGLDRAIGRILPRKIGKGERRGVTSVLIPRYVDTAQHTTALLHAYRYSQQSSDKPSK